ncbi:MAG: cyclohydrolase [Actinomycetota bacterium]|jgi:GTP cyclohydrolase I|nr:cyclohydrolase [Actinomycetota bacterium]
MAPIDTGRVEAAVAEILAAIGEDPSRPGLLETPARVAASYADFFSGLDVDPLEHLASAADLDLPQDKLGELVLLRDIDFRSICEHHLLPFTGVAHVAYVPSRRIVGLGKIPRVVETLASRPQLQERLTEEIAETLNVGLEPDGVLVVLDASHRCVSARGARQVRSTTVTVATRGSLSDPVQRSGVLALIGGVGAGHDG